MYGDYANMVIYYLLYIFGREGVMLCDLLKSCYGKTSDNLPSSVVCQHTVKLFGLSVLRM